MTHGKPYHYSSRKFTATVPTWFFSGGHVGENGHLNSTWEQSGAKVLAVAPVYLIGIGINDIGYVTLTFIDFVSTRYVDTSTLVGDPRTVVYSSYGSPT